MPDFSSIISKSIEITKKQKWIWLYAVVLSLFSGGTGSGFRGFANKSDLSPSSDSFKNLPQESEKVMGAMTSNLIDWVTSVSVDKWVFLALGILLLIILGIIISYIARAWSKSGLIYSLDKALKGDSITLANTSPQVFKYLKNMVLFGIIQTLFGIGIVLGIVLVWMILYFIFNLIEPLRVFLQVIAGIGGVVGIFYLAIMLSLLGVLGDRKIILKGTKPLETWKQSFGEARKNMRSGIVMGIVGTVVSWLFSLAAHIVGLIILGLPIFVLLFPSISQGKFPPVLYVVIAVINAVVFFTLSRMIGVVTTVFKYANWNQYYDTLINKNDN